MQVVRYVHIRQPKVFMDSAKGGATIRIVGDTEKIGSVQLQSVECSQHDNYCKKIGRSLAEKAPEFSVPLAQLPKALADIAKTAKRHGRVGMVSTNFEYTIKYFLPKE